MKKENKECITQGWVVFRKIIEFYEFIYWFIMIGFRRKAIPCWMATLDSKLLLITLSAFSLFVVGLIIEFFFHFTSPLRFFLLFVGCSSSIILKIRIEKTLKVGKKQFSECQEYKSDKEHHGIIFPIYIKKQEDYSLIPLFVDGFYGKIPYKIYPIKEKRDFLKVYYNNQVPYLWILGHGQRGQLCFGKCDDEDCICYSKRLPQSSKKFIAQLHCNAGKGRTLAEVNGLTIDHENNSIRFEFQNKYYIKKKIEEFVANFNEIKT
jgi:hypothetical protein